LVRQRRLEAAVLPLALDRHAQDVGGALQKCEVMGCELVLRLAVDLKDTERPAVALEDYIDGTVNAVADEKIGGAKPLLIFQELADEAFAALLRKHGRPTDLKTALRESVAGMDKRPPASSVKRGGGRKTAGNDNG
jgi:hypothetical protein